MIALALMLAGLVLATAPDTSRTNGAVTASDSTAASAATGSDSLPMVLRPAGIVTRPDGERGHVIEPAGVAVDPFGHIVISDAAQRSVQRYDANGAWLGETGALGSDAGQMRRPGAVAALGTL